MNPILPRSTALVLLAGRLLTTLLALGALLSKPLERALFACLVLAVTWFVVEVAVTLWHQHEREVARRERDNELKRQRAEEARLRFEAAQREAQAGADESLLDLVHEEEDSSDARIPLEALMKKGVDSVTPPAPVAVDGAAGTVSGMSALDFDMALMHLDAESNIKELRRA